jgi:hypothetical protein
MASAAGHRPEPGSPPDRVVLVIPAKDEGQRIAATVRGGTAVPSVDAVVVVDDGSGDDTAQQAWQAGAHVVRHRRNRGKAQAMQTGAAYVRRSFADPSSVALLFLDADLEDSAQTAGRLVRPVLDGVADMTIATLPQQRRAGGGRGFVVNLSRSGIRRATGWEATQPLSGQRCITSDAFAAAQPLASGFGVETGLTIDLLRAGYRVQEVEVNMHHRVTGTNWRAQVHRGRQWWHVLKALVARGAVPFR